jgi:hypothetical protein
VKRSQEGADNEAERSELRLKTNILLPLLRWKERERGREKKRNRGRSMEREREMKEVMGKTKI